MGVACGLKLRVGGKKNPDAETVTGGFISPEREKIKECGVDLPLEPIYFFKNQPV